MIAALLGELLDSKVAIVVIDVESEKVVEHLLHLLRFVILLTIRVLQAEQMFFLSAPICSASKWLIYKMLRSGADGADVLQTFPVIVKEWFSSAVTGMSRLRLSHAAPTAVSCSADGCFMPRFRIYHEAIYPRLGHDLG